MESYTHKIKEEQYSRFNDNSYYLIEGSDAKKLESLLVALGDVTIRIEGDYRRDMENALCLIINDNFIEFED